VIAPTYLAKPEVIGEFGLRSSVHSLGQRRAGAIWISLRTAVPNIGGNISDEGKQRSGK
jgi:hypothetical protein